MCELQKGCWQSGQDLEKVYREALKILPSEERLNLFLLFEKKKRWLEEEICDNNSSFISCYKIQEPVFGSRSYTWLRQSSVCGCICQLDHLQCAGHWLLLEVCVIKAESSELQIWWCSATNALVCVRQIRWSWGNGKNNIPNFGWNLTSLQI